MGISDWTIFKGISDPISPSGKWDTGCPWHTVAKQLFKSSLWSPRVKCLWKLPTESTALSEQITCSIRYFSRNKGFYFGWLDYIYINGWLDVLKYAVEHGKRR